jgi:hypothetical protein
MKLKASLLLLLSVLLLPAVLFAKCPISAGGILELRAPAGNLLVETNGTDSVEVEVSNRQVLLNESCGRDTVVFTAKAPTSIGIPDWKIRVPRNITLDLSTEAGNIQVGDTDGEARLRTGGGKVVAGNIKGNALIRATEIRVGNVGGHVELRGLGGRLQIGDVGGNAEFYTPGGDVTAGVVRGGVKAVLESGSITIRESNGDVVVSITKEGSITSEYVHGSFDGNTVNGNIRIANAGSWVKAITGVGDIFFRLVPTNLSGDLHVTAEAAFGNITVYVPKAMKATFNAVVEKPAMGTKSIFSDFPVPPVKAPVNAGLSAIKALIPGSPEKQNAVVNGGGNPVKLRTSSGTIKILAGN